MRLLERILVPVDLGVQTEEVVAASANLAGAVEAKVHLLFVIEELPHFPAAPDLLQQAARERLEKLQDNLVTRGILCAPPVIRIGKPAEAIVQAAIDSRANLIVLGRGHSSSAEQPTLGSTAGRVIRRSSCPVLAVAPGSPGTISRILCPVDGSSASGRGLRNALLLARSLRARLTVTTVIPDLGIPLPDVSRPDFVQIRADYEAMERDQFEQFLRGFDFREVNWDKEVHYGRPAAEIVRLASEAKYDLIVLGSSGRSGLPRVLLGSTAEKVARDAPCSVLLVKREDALANETRAEIRELQDMLQRGFELLSESRADEALAVFDQCLLKAPYLAPAIEGQAAAQEQLGHPELAAELSAQAQLIRQELWRQRTPKEVLMI